MIKSLQYNVKKSRYKGNKFLFKKINNNDLEFKKLSAINIYNHNKNPFHNKKDNYNTDYKYNHHSIYKRHTSYDYIEKDYYFKKNFYYKNFRDNILKDVDLSCGNKKTLNKSNSFINNTYIFKKILQNYKKKNKVKSIKIIKCELNMNNTNSNNKKLFVNNKIKSNYSYFKSKLNINNTNININNTDANTHKYNNKLIKNYSKNKKTRTTNNKSMQCVNINKKNYLDNYSIRVPSQYQTHLDGEIYHNHSTVYIYQLNKPIAKNTSQNITKNLKKKSENYISRTRLRKATPKEDIFSTPNRMSYKEIPGSKYQIINKTYIDNNDILNLINENKNNKKINVNKKNTEINLAKKNNEKMNIDEEILMYYNYPKKSLTSFKKLKENSNKKDKESYLFNEYKNKLDKDIQNYFSDKEFFSSIKRSGISYIEKKENENDKDSFNKEIKELKKNLFNDKKIENNQNKLKKKYFKTKELKRCYIKSVINNCDKNKKLIDKSKININDIKIFNKTKEINKNIFNDINNENEIIDNKINKKNNCDKIIMNEINENIKNKNVKNIKNNDLKNKRIINKSNTNIFNLTSKIKRYNGIKNKTLKDINNNSVQNINKNIGINIFLRNSNNKEDYINMNNNIIINNNYINTDNYIKTSNTNTNINNKSKNKTKNNTIYKKDKMCQLSNNKNKYKKNIKSNLTDINLEYKRNNNTNNFKKGKKELQKIINDTSNNNEYKVFSNNNSNNNLDIMTDINGNIDELYNKQFQDINNNNRKEIKDNNDINNLRCNSYNSQLISNINSPFSNTFSFNKSDIKLINRINFDMPVNIDLDKIETEESKDENKNFIYSLDNQAKIETIKIDIMQPSLSDTHNTYKNSKIEKLETFINKFNEENSKELISKKDNIMHINNEIPGYGQSIAKIGLSNDENNESIYNDQLNKNNREVFIEENEKLSENDKKININKNYNIDMNLNNKIKRGNTNYKNKKTDNNYINNMGFYDDIEIKDTIDNAYNSNTEKCFNILDINTDTPSNAQYFLDNLELIHKTRIYSVIAEGKKEEKEFNIDSNRSINNSNNIKEPVSEYEFNLKEGKFYKPLTKYEDKFNLDKINPF